MFPDPEMSAAGMHSKTPEGSRRGTRVALGDAGERTEPRRNRVNPRVIKRKMSKWKKKRPEHRHLPPLKKTFPETVVMIR